MVKKAIYLISSGTILSLRLCFRVMGLIVTSQSLWFTGKPKVEGYSETIESKDHPSAGCAPQSCSPWKKDLTKASGSLPRKAFRDAYCDILVYHLYR